MTLAEAELKPVGKGQDEPNQHPTLEPPKYVIIHIFISIVKLHRTFYPKRTLKLTLQETRDLFPMVHVSMEDPETHHMEELQVVLYWWSHYPLICSVYRTLHLLNAGKIIYNVKLYSARRLYLFVL